MPIAIEELARHIYDYAVDLGIPVGKSGWDHKNKGEGSTTAYYKDGVLCIDGMAETKLEDLIKLKIRFPQIREISLFGYDLGLYVRINLRSPYIK